MTIYVHLKSDMNTLTYDDVEVWNEVMIGDKRFLYVRGGCGRYRAYLSVEDIVRMTIEEGDNDT